MVDRRHELIVAEIARRLRPEARRLVAALGLPGKFVGPKFVGLHKSEGGLGASFEVILDGRKAGHFFHNAAGAGGDLLNLVKYVRGGSTGDAVRFAKNFLGIEEGKPLPPAKPMALPEGGRRHRADADRRRLRAGTIWNNAADPAGTLAETYLRARGYRGTIPATIRFHPSLYHDLARVTFPALVAYVSDVERSFLGLWRIYLDPAGAGKAKVEKPKLGLGDCAGGAVRLSPLTGTRLDAAEGLETSLDVLQRFPHRTVWATLSTGGMRGLVLPPAVTELVLWADADPQDLGQYLEFTRSDGELVRRPNPAYHLRPGTAAAEARAQKAKAQGVLCSIVHPGSGDGTDFADVFGSEGVS